MYEDSNRYFLEALKEKSKTTFGILERAIRIPKTYCELKKNSKISKINIITFTEGQRNQISVPKPSEKTRFYSIYSIWRQFVYYRVEKCKTNLQMEKSTHRKCLLWILVNQTGLR